MFGLTDADLHNRLVKVLRLTAVADAICACINVDRSRLPTVDGVDAPVPTIDHTLADCEACGERVWVGPAQKELIGATIICYVCSALLSCVVATENIALNPANDLRPKRNVGGGR